MANPGIRSGADGDHQAARIAWREALTHAEQHLPGDGIIPWTRSGLGDALLRCGDVHGALEMAGSALACCASMRALAAALTMTEACLRLGEVTRARDYARQACRLRGEPVSRVFGPADRDAPGPIALSDNAA